MHHSLDSSQSASTAALLLFYNFFLPALTSFQHRVKYADDKMMTAKQPEQIRESVRE